MNLDYTRFNPATTEVWLEGFLAAGDIFRPEYIHMPEDRYLQFLDVHQDVLLDMVRDLLLVWQAAEHNVTRSHDRVHIAFDLLEFLYGAHTIPSRSLFMITLFGSLLHDLGRYPEMQSGEADENVRDGVKVHSVISAQMAGEILSMYNDRFDQTFNDVKTAFFQRIVAVVLRHSGGNIDVDLAAWLVPTYDRLAGILGIRQWPRNLLQDGVRRGAPIYPDYPRLNFSEKFPGLANLPVASFTGAAIPEESFTSIGPAGYTELTLRNLYPLATPEATRRGVEMRVQGGILLSYLCGGPDSDLYAQTFAPEIMGLNPGFPKQRIPDHIWEGIVAGPIFDERLIMDRYQDWEINRILRLLLDQQTIDLPEDVHQDALDYVGDVPSGYGFNEGVRQACIYAIARRRLDSAQETNFLLKMVESEDPFISLIAQELLGMHLWQPEPVPA